MRRSNFFLVYLLLVVAQILICNYFHLTSFVMLSILPVLVLCIPIRIPLIRLVFGEDLISRNEDFSVRKYGFGKVTLAILIVQSLFLAVYILADGAGTRPPAFNAIRFCASLLAGYLLSLILIDTLAPDTRK